MSIGSLGNYQNNSSGMSWLFPSSSSSGQTGFPSVSDHALIKTGAYKKLLNAYYSSSNNKSLSSDAVDISAERKEKVNLVAANTDSKALASAIASFNGVEIIEENREEVKSSIEAVVENYNKLVDSGSEVDNVSVLRNVLWMTQGTSENSRMLSDIGITIQEGNKLSFNEEKFNEADLSTVKSMKSGNSSFFGKLMTRALTISSESAGAVNQDMAGSVYSKTGMKFGSINPAALIDKRS